MFDRPNQGFCVDAECRGNPGISRFQLYDLTDKKIVAISDKFYATNNVAEFLGLANAIHYCIKHGIDNLFTDSNTAISWMRKGRVNTKMSSIGEFLHTGERVAKALDFRKGLTYTPQNCGFAIDGSIVFIHKWETAEWGEIPADFGNKY